MSCINRLYEEITEDAAKAQCQYFKEFAQRLQSEIKVELEEMINNFVQNNAQGLLNEYRSRIADLAKDLDVGIATCIVLYVI